MYMEIKALIGVINFLVKSGRLSTEESDCLIKTTRDLVQAFQTNDRRKVRKFVVKLTRILIKIIALVN